ncbi:MAG TPA: SUMF1/EgtB/PvdO family nonheme iron enzyme, partial [Thermoanaerobaculia bacterium]|nr:SUMF1/EgtB/PvdO family nonheme iron enzyme [Thermoanaerobaculia bacterium]
IPTLKEKSMVLQAVAFHYLKNDLLEAGVPALCEVIEPLLPRIKAQIAADVLLRQIWERSGILQEQRLGFFGFAHRALHDYLAAAYLVEHELDSLLLERAGEERWREVILIAAGLAPVDRAERLVKALLEKIGDSGAELEMAGFTLAEDIQLGEDLRAEVKKRLLDRLTHEEAAGPYRRLAGALLAADPEAARRWMEEELRGLDPQRQQRVLELLPELGESQAPPMATLLARLVEDDSGETAVRAKAARALATIRFTPDVRIWQALALAQHGEPSLKRAANWAWCELGGPEDLGLVRVPAGEFRMGSLEGEGDPDERPQHVLYLPTFYIGKRPVTVGTYRDYLEKSGRPVADGEALERWNRHADHPVVGVSWHAALAFADWHGFTLPSEAEWEKAARGPDGRRYPWGNEWKLGCANSAEHWSGGGGLLLFSWRRSRRLLGATTTVGQFSPQGDSPYGCVEMAGNVWEWTRTLWGEDALKPTFAYPYAAGDGREDLDASSQDLRVLRGGAFLINSRHVRCAYRGRDYPGSWLVSIGFRVVLSPFPL